jgi:leader peptidase (prepilin peptidase) / N-methyltransferase
VTVLQTISLMQQVLVFALGCCLGSFYNVVIHRLPAGESLVSPGSHCPGCRNPIAFYDNVPLLSYLVLRGRCRRCGAAISARYPLVEGVAGLFALLLYRKYGFHPQLAVEFFFVSLLLVISFIDLDTFLIPDVLSLPGIAAGFALSFLTPRLSWIDSLLGILVGGGILYAIAVSYAFLRKKEGMGGGDIKLLGMIGAFVGLEGVIFTVVAASVVGMAVALPILWRKKGGMGTAIPFGPFLSIGAVCYLFWGQLLVQWYLYGVLGMS